MLEGYQTHYIFMKLQRLRIVATGAFVRFTTLREYTKVRIAHERTR